MRVAEVGLKAANALLLRVTARGRQFLRAIDDAEALRNYGGGKIADETRNFHIRRFALLRSIFRASGND
jgi:hypothetical protein